MVTDLTQRWWLSVFVVEGDASFQLAMKETSEPISPLYSSRALLSCPEHETVWVPSSLLLLSGVPLNFTSGGM